MPDYTVTLRYTTEWTGTTHVRAKTLDAAEKKFQAYLAKYVATHGQTFAVFQQLVSPPGDVELDDEQIDIEEIVEE